MTDIPGPGHPRRVGVLGGTFDPPHRGHLQVARTVRDALDLDLVVLMVAGEPWQKVAQRSITPAEVRLEMVRALVAGESGITVGDDEVRRGGPTYTVDTLRALRESHPTTEFFLVLGSDAARNLPTWREADAVVGLSTLVVVNRPGDDRAIPVEGAEVEFVEMAPVDVSSSQIRADVAAGRTVVSATTPAVAEIIARLDLYSGS